MINSTNYGKNQFSIDKYSGKLGIRIQPFLKENPSCRKCGKENTLKWRGLDEKQ